MPQKSSTITYPKVSVMDTLRIFSRLSKKYWLSLTLAIVGTIAGNILQTIVPLYYKAFFDLISSGRPAMEISDKLSEIIVVILILNSFIWLVFRINNFGMTWFETYMMSKLRVHAFGYILDHSYTFFANNFTGSLTQRINRFARAFERLVDRALFDLIPLVIKVTSITLVLWIVNHLAAYFMIGWLVVLVTFNYLLARWKLKYDIRGAEIDSKLTATSSDAITNHNSIQLFTSQKEENDRYFQVNEESRKINTLRWNIDNVVGAIQFGLVITAEFLLFYFGLKYWKSGEITIGSFILIQSYFMALSERLWNMTRTVRDVYEGFADAKEMVEILKLEHEIKDIPNASILKVTEGKIEFKDATFAFNQTRIVLEKINIHIKSGEKVALIGPSGAGKSTFVRLLLRLYDLHGGEISIDGQNIAKVAQNSLRSNISLVPQDPVLFHRTLMENIRYGKRDASDSEVIEAAKLSHCDEFIDALPNKYETYVGERGIKLSGGERQRVAIARAILKNAPILVLDEATSSLDSHSESLIQDALDRLMKGKTTIVIAHRLSTIRKMDRIIVMDSGKIVEEGSHQKLVEKQDGLYAKLWSLQAGGFLKDEATSDSQIEGEI